MNVKAQALLHGAAWLEASYGAEERARVLGACSPTVRERLASASPGDWIPQEELSELLAAADRLLGPGDGTVAEALGAASARVNLRNLSLRLSFFLGRPEFLMRRVAGVWRQYNEAGQMRVLEFVDGRMGAELAGMPVPDWYICCSITGWLREAGIATGMRGLVARNAGCRARGGERCVWDLRWDRSAP